jgi:hypothetical protein
VATAFARSIVTNPDKAELLRSQLRVFLETGPLYRPEDFVDKVLPNQFPRRCFPLPWDVRIQTSCPFCPGVPRTFALERGDWKTGDRQLSLSDCSEVSFRCTHCEKQRLWLMLFAYKSSNGVALIKVGQFPSDRPAPAPDIARALGTLATLYTKGLTVERFGFGIAAFAYYRRVTEAVIDGLMSDLRRYADDHGLAELVRAIDELDNEQQASKRIAAVKDLLPRALRPEGHGNPLGTLYAALSGGLHEDTDEACLELAASLRAALEFLLRVLSAHEKATEAYAGALQSIQAKNQPSKSRPPAETLTASPEGDTSSEESP